MGRSEEVVRRDVEDGERRASSASGPVTPVTAKAPELPRIPDPAFNISVRPDSPNVVIEDRPIEVIPTKQVIPDPDAFTIEQPYESAVNKVLAKLDAYAKANGAQVEPSSVRPSSSRPVASSKQNVTFDSRW